MMALVARWAMVAWLGVCAVALGVIAAVQTWA